MFLENIWFWRRHRSLGSNPDLQTEPLRPEELCWVKVLSELLPAGVLVLVLKLLPDILQVPGMGSVLQTEEHLQNLFVSQNLEEPSMVPCSDVPQRSTNQRAEPVEPQ